jgi:cytoskeletal protein CcmA (bactofilin family)
MLKKLIAKLLGRTTITTSVPNFTSLVGAGMTTGPILLEKGTIQINGFVDGFIDGKDSIVYVGKNGIVSENIECDVLVVEGVVHGSVTAREVCLHSSANVGTNSNTVINYETLQVYPGAVSASRLEWKNKIVNQPAMEQETTAL